MTRIFRQLWSTPELRREFLTFLAVMAVGGPVAVLLVAALP